MTVAVDSSTLTPRQIAARWQVKLDTVYSLINANRLPAFNVASPGSTMKRFRVRVEDVERFEGNQAVVHQPKRVTRRRRVAAGVTEFF